jgi:short-subunit dehydrogenase
MDNKNKIALITGCSSGVGLYTAVRLAKTDFKVYATMRHLEKADKLKQFANEQRVHLEIRRLDVQNDESVSDCVKSILAEEERIDVLVNNAGFGYIRTLEQASMREIENVMDVNYYGAIRCIKAVLPSMRERKSGHIISVTSVGGLIGQPMNEIYCSSKFALEGLIESMATYLEPFFNIKMSIIEPGAIQTEFVNRVLGDMQKSGGVLNDDYAPVLKTYMDTAKKSFAAGQSPDEVARVILDCILSEKPYLRYQTSDKAREFIAAKLGNDPTGDIQQKKIRKLQLDLE